ncbi:TPA: DNA-binding protein, partial [Stenotrophomonas maltophilia]|nr:DNA-binding protein [Stenotrophomonas maltophilia]
MEFNFTLKYRLPDMGDDIGDLEGRLAEAGCDDALVGLGLPGRLALAFCREADSAGAALRSALDDVQRAAPGAE